MFDSPKWTRKKVQRLRRRGKISQAINLQRQLCQTDDQNRDDWQALAELAHEGEHRDLELAARVQVAKLNAAGPNEWLELAEQAKKAGFRDDAVDATFRAADAAARLGDCKFSLELCDRVLAMASDHRPAKRIRGIMERRVAAMMPDDEPDTWKNWPPERDQKDKRDHKPADDDDRNAEEEFDDPDVTPPLLPLEPPPLEFRVTKRIPGSASGIARARSSALEQQSHAAVEDGLALEGSEPHAPTTGEERSGPESFVWVPQTWPSVLDWNCLMFVGGIDRISEEVLELADVMEIPAKVPIYEQGKTGQLLYCLDEGEVRAFRERGSVQDFGAISAGSFFGEVSTITGFPSTATVSTQEPCRLRVFTREKFQRRHRAGDASASKLLSFLRTWYMEVAANLSPLLSHCSPEELGLLADSSNWTTFQPGAVLAEEGEPGDLYTIIAGLTEVSRPGEGGDEELGFLTTGDLIGAMSPSPVTVKAASLVFALKVDRNRVKGLAPVPRTKLEEHMAECRRVLRWLDEQEAS